MDGSAVDIEFDVDGVCNFCRAFEERSRSSIHPSPTVRERRLREFVDRLKDAGRRKAYDCVVGVSGGVDSSWVLVKAVELGLRPLAVHMDNGWNSELAQANISSLVTSLDVDLFTYVIDWEEYRGLMQAFFDADVIDIELLYDNAMLGVNFGAAAQHNLRHILSGSNIATEGVPMPSTWVWLKNDARNIRQIARRQNLQLRTFPAYGTVKHVWNSVIRRCRMVPFLDYLDYRKESALEELEQHYGFKRYPYKHYESVFTRFYQGHILPTKFGIDKRRVHLSSLIMSNQITREEALAHFRSSPYPSDEALRQDCAYFIKKMGWREEDLNRYLNRGQVSHRTYGSEERLWNTAAAMGKWVRWLGARRQSRV